VAALSALGWPLLAGGRCLEVAVKIGLTVLIKQILSVLAQLIIFVLVLAGLNDDLLETIFLRHEKTSCKIKGPNNALKIPGIISDR
jgi:hypothetical protein